MDLLLTHGYFLYEDPRELQVMKPYVPLGILYLTSHLRAKNLSVEVFDSTFSSRVELLTLLQSEEPSVLGIYANLMTRSSVLQIAAAAKHAGWKVVAGGPEPGAYVEEYLDAGVDVVVIGEGEITLEELVPVLRCRSGRSMHDICGIAFRTQDGRTVRTPPRAQIPDIDGQPWPSRESVPIERYLETWRTHHQTGSVSLITARGCPYDCRWCSHAVFGKTHRRRRPASVANELEWILHRYNPDMFWIADDVFTIHHGWLEKFAEELKVRDIHVPFECISRADRINARVADLLAEMSCFRIWIGSESGSQRILDAMERGVTVQEVQTSVELCRSRGIQTGMFLMWGYEGEELEDIEATVEHVKRVRPDVFFTTVAYPIKGTPYFNDVAGRVSSTVSWTQGSDRDFRIRGRHSRSFYRSADELLHAEVELESMLSSEGSEIERHRSELVEKVAQVRQIMRSTFHETEA